MVKDLHKYVSPDKVDDLRRRLNRSQNFLKHADSDPEGELVFNPEETEVPMFEAVLKYRELTGAMAFPRFGGHYLKGGYDVQNANQNSG